MAPVNIDRYRMEGKALKQAAVLLLLFRDPLDKEWNIVFIKRTQRSNDVHSGQISFPGGKLEENDISYEACALRETQEELGIDATQIRILRGLTPLYVFASKFKVFPFIGYLTVKPTFSPNTDEVESILTYRVKDFLDPHSKYTSKIAFYESVPHYKIGNTIIWGATAMIFSEFEILLNTSLNQALTH